MKTQEEAIQEFGRAIETAMEQLSGNNAGPLAAELVRVIKSQHRTTQQVFMGVLKLAINFYSMAPSDPRNQAAVEWAREVSGLAGAAERFPYI